MYPVASLVSSVRNDGPDSIEPVDRGAERRPAPPVTEPFAAVNSAVAVRATALSS